MFWLIEYKGIILFFLFSFFLTILLILVSFVLSYKDKNFEKWTSYECGFDPFDDSKNLIDIQFFIVCIIFIIFDLEIVLVFPLVVTLGLLNVLSYYIFFFFFL